MGRFSWASPVEKPVLHGVLAFFVFLPPHRALRQWGRLGQRERPVFLLWMPGGGRFAGVPGDVPDRLGNQRAVRGGRRCLRLLSGMPAAKAHSHEAAFVEGHALDVAGDSAQAQDGGGEGVFCHHQPQAQA